MNISEMKDRIRQEMEQKDLNETRVAAMAAEKYPELGIGHQYVRNLLRSNKTATVDVQKLRAVADVLGICGGVMGEPVEPHAQQISPQLESLIACVRALVIHAVENREADSELGAFAGELARSVSVVCEDLPREQVLRIRAQSSEIAKRCVAAGSASSKRALHLEQTSLPPQIDK